MMSNRNQADRPKDFLDLVQWPEGLLEEVLELARELKQGPDRFARALAGKSLAMLFMKSSTRTRVSFEVGMFQLGGQALFMSPAHTQLGRGEPIEDTARVLSRYVDGIMIRTFAHREVETLAEWASVPVINGLTDYLHPCQVLTDVFTICEYLHLDARGLSGLRVAWIGDGNNMANSWINAARVFGFELVLACPDGYEPDRELLSVAGERVQVVRDPAMAARGAQVLNTDVWASMGQEEEAEKRRQSFAGYQINDELLRLADPSALVLHCLPAHRGEEITAAAFEKNQATIFTQAENRLHVQKALLVTLLAGRGE